MKFEPQNARKFEFGNIKGLAYNSAKDFANVDVVFLEAYGNHGKSKNTKSDRVYIIIEGKGEFIIDGQKTPVIKDDVIIIPKDTLYDFSVETSIMKMIEINTPAFDPEAEVEFE